MTTKSLEDKALANKVILVTGASQGLGAEVAKSCAAAGATVVLLGRSQKKLEKVYDEVLAAGDVEPFAICFDMMGAQELEFEQLARTLAEATQGKLDGVIHCASYFYALSPLDFQTVAEWVNQYRINTVAPMALTLAADEWERFPNLRANVLVPGSINSPQRIKTHPGETAAERKDMADITPDFVWWASEQSRGRSGEIVYL